MTTPELITFVKGEIAKGASRDAVTSMLKPQGWSDVDINDTFNAIYPASILIQNPNPILSPTLVVTPIVVAQAQKPPVTPIAVLVQNPMVSPVVKPTPSIPLSAIHYPNNASSNNGVHSHKKSIIISSILVLIILIAGGAFAYTSGYLSPLEKVFSKYFQSSEPAETEIVRTDFSNKTDSVNPESLEIPNTSTNNTDSTDTNSINQTVTPIDTKPKESSTDTKVKSVESSFRAQAELFYTSNSNSYKGFCSSKGVNGGYSLAITLPPNTVYKCRDSVSDWISYSKITSGYFCVDSTGFSKTVDTLPTGKSCSI